MKVLFIGPSGVNLTDAVEKLANHYRLTEGGLSHTQLGDLGNAVLSTYHVEKHLPLQAYLDLDSLYKQQEMWEKAMKETLDEITKTQSKHYFLGMHLPHYRKDKFFPVPIMQLILEYDPDIIITLIDDIHTCYQRIKKRQKTRSVFTMRDILLWRSMTVYVGDIIARAISTEKQVPNYVVAVKHPVTMFQKLIFHNEILRSYCSFSITSIRDIPKKKELVNQFRKIMHEKFCVFDPLTIDDKMSQNKYNELKKQGKISEDALIVLDGSERWDLGSEFSLIGDYLSESEKKSIFPIEIKASELQEISEKKKTEQGEDPSVIDSHIRERDFRLIDQSDTMVAFRPNISGTISDGVAEEANYISQVNPKNWFYLWPKEDGDIESGPFKPFVGKGVPFQDEGLLIKNLEERTDQLKKA